MFLTFLNTVTHDLVVDGRYVTLPKLLLPHLLHTYCPLTDETLFHIYSINLGLRPFNSAFGKFHIALGLWVVMQTLSTLVYFAFRFWAHLRSHLGKSE